MTSAVRVVRLSPQDWRIFKVIRLEALRLEPAAFSSAYAETRTRPDESWRQWLETPRCLVLVALAGERPIGIVGAYLGSEDGDASVAFVFGMYVNREYRRQGVGRRLLTSLMDLVLEFPEIAAIRLWVTEERDSARILYESVGFQVVSRESQKLLGDGLLRDELVMERSVR
jgi:ribosomal protein S18 acetylase RimI-like enzyme